MKRRFIVVSVLIMVFGSQMLIAATSDSDIPGNVRNNRYFLESIRLANLAEQSFDEGDYDASAKYSEESVRYAEMSDEYVRVQLKMRETDDAIAAARKRLDYATSVNAARRYSEEYGRAQVAYAEARAFRASERWDEAIIAANRVLVALAYVSAEERQQPLPPPQAPVQTNDGALPSQYTVRSWNISKDCLWNIAGRPWVYNDPRKWKTLYEANKSKMPQPNNPDLIEPGMILDIPAIKGEVRQGSWDASKTYSTLP